MSLLLPGALAAYLLGSKFNSQPTLDYHALAELYNTDPEEFATLKAQLLQIDPYVNGETDISSANAIIETLRSNMNAIEDAYSKSRIDWVQEKNGYLTLIEALSEGQLAGGLQIMPSVDFVGVPQGGLSVNSDGLPVIAGAQPVNSEATLLRCEQQLNTAGTMYLADKELIGLKNPQHPERSATTLNFGGSVPSYYLFGADMFSVVPGTFRTLMPWMMYFVTPPTYDQRRGYLLSFAPQFDRLTAMSQIDFSMPWYGQNLRSTWIRDNLLYISGDFGPGGGFCLTTETTMSLDIESVSIVPHSDNFF
jgi:hypothetical protein